MGAVDLAVVGPWGDDAKDWVLAARGHPLQAAEGRETDRDSSASNTISRAATVSSYFRPTAGQAP